MVVEEVPSNRWPEGQIPDELMFVVLKTVGPLFPLETAQQDPAALGSHLVSQATQAQELGWLDPSLDIPAKLQSLQTALAADNASLSGDIIGELQTLLTTQNGDGVTSDGYALLSPSLSYLAIPHRPGDASFRQTLEKINDTASRALLGFDRLSIETAPRRR